MHNIKHQTNPLTGHAAFFPIKRSVFRTLSKACLILFSTLLLSACSSTKMAYELLDWVAMWKIDRMVDLKSGEREQVKEEIRRLHDWHRKTQLPRYADYLEQLQARLRTDIASGSVTGPQIHAETDRVQLMLDDVLGQVLPVAAEVIAGLDDEQIAGMLDNIAEERQEYVEEYVEPDMAERRKKNINELKDNLKLFIGRLTSKQEDWVEDWSKQLLPYAELSAAQQLLWQEHLNKYLIMRQNKALLEEGLNDLMLYRTDNWHPELEKAMDANQALTYDLLARILNNLTPKQEQHLFQRLQGFIDDFRALAAKGQQAVNGR